MVYYIAEASCHWRVFIADVVSGKSTPRRGFSWRFRVELLSEVVGLKGENQLRRRDLGGYHLVCGE